MNKRGEIYLKSCYVNNFMNKMVKVKKSREDDLYKFSKYSN